MIISWKVSGGWLNRANWTEESFTLVFPELHLALDPFWGNVFVEQGTLVKYLR